MNFKSSIFFMIFTFSFIGLVYPVEHLLNQEYREITSDIQSLNLINGLNLTERQLSGLIQLNEKLKNYLKTIKPDFRRIVSEYKKYKRKLLKQGYGIDQKYFKKIEQLHHQEVRLKAGLAEFYNNLAGELRQLLSTAQFKVARDFDPCIVPPENMKNPVRTGQAGSNDRFVKMLETFRKLPSFLVSFAFEQFWKRVSVHVKMMLRDDAKVIRHKEIVRSIIMKARNMDEKNFQLSKRKLAKQVIPELPEIYKLYKSTGHWGARFLLNPDLLKSYRIMLRRME